MDPDLTRGEIVHQGWLIKSPPLETKKQIFRAVSVTPKWRRRWFVLREGGVPGQYLLCYYSNSSARKLKGVIDLDCLEQVDSGLTFESGKVKYQFMFDIKTPKRVYYLAADSEQAMSQWVECVCQVCGLRPYQDQVAEEEEGEEEEETAVTSQQLTVTSQPAAGSSSSRTAAISGPYMHLSECFTGAGGRPPVAIESHVRSRMPSSSSRLPPPPRLSSPTYQNNPGTSGHLASSSAAVDDTMLGDDSVFLPSSPPSSKPPRPPGNSSSTDPAPVATASVAELSGGHGLFSKLKVSDLPGLVPGRPPKPPGLRNLPVNYPSQPAGETYANHEEMQRVALTSKSDAAAFSVHEKNNNTTTTMGPLLLDPQQQKQQQHCSEGFFGPQIDRRLKPYRKGSLGEATTMPSNARISTSNAASTTHGHHLNNSSGPPVERRLKPRSGSTDGGKFGTVGGGVSSGHFGTVPRLDPGGPLFSPPLPGGHSSGMVHPLGCRFRNGESDESLSDFDSRRSSVEEEQIYYYMPSLSQCQGSRWEGPPIMIPATEMLDPHNRIQYLDLDLPANSTSNSMLLEEDPRHQQLPGEVNSRTRDSETVYKTVDFIKTEAFNRTRMNVEENRSKMNPD